MTLYSITVVECATGSLPGCVFGESHNAAPSFADRNIVARQRSQDTRCTNTQRRTLPNTGSSRSAPAGSKFAEFRSRLQQCQLGTTTVQGSPHTSSRACYNESILEAPSKFKVRAIQSSNSYNTGTTSDAIKVHSSHRLQQVQCTDVAENHEAKHWTKQGQYGKLHCISHKTNNFY